MKRLLYRFGLWLVRRYCPSPLPKFEILNKAVTIDFSQFVADGFWHQVTLSFWFQSTGEQMIVGEIGVRKESSFVSHMRQLEIPLEDEHA